jgi:cell division septum initiation protein DivIVA
VGYDDEEPFDVVMFGYDKDQVDAYVQAQAKAEKALMRQTLGFAEIEAQLTDSQAEAARLRTKVAGLTEDLTSGKPSMVMSSRMAGLFKMAEEEAAAIRAEANNLLETARADAETIRRQAREDANLAAATRRHVTESKPRNTKKSLKGTN